MNHFQINPQARMEEILELMRINHPSAYDELREFARANPDYPDPWAHLAWNMNELGYLQEAYDAALHLVTLLPDNTDVQKLLSRICLQLDKPEEALSAMQRAVQVSPNRFSHRMEYIEILLRLGCPYQALREYMQLRKERTPELAIPTRFTAKLAAHLAVTSLGMVLPGIRNVVFRKTFNYFERKGRWSAAYIVVCNAAAFSKDAGAWAERAADALYNKREFLFPAFEDEIVWRNIAYRKKADRAAEKLARVYLDAGRPVKAFSVLEHESALSPEGKIILAHALSMMNRSTEAAEIYQEAGRQNLMHYVNAGIACLMSDNQADALHYLKQARAEDPSHPMAAFLHAVALEENQNQPLSAARRDEILQELAQQQQWKLLISEQRNDWDIRQQSLLQTGKYHWIACPNCRADSFEAMVLDPNLKPHWVRGRCRNCGFLYANPQPLPETIVQLYTTESAQSSPLQRFFRQNLNELLNQPPQEVGTMFGRKERWWEPEFSLPEFERERGEKRHMLDVGCSVGTTMYQYHCRGWQTSGIDLDDCAVQTARNLGLNAQITTLEDAEFPPDTFDFITMMDVIEHVADHKPLIEKLYSILKPGGILKLKTPCPESIVHYQYGPQWVASDTHLLYFSRRILTRCLEDHDFEIMATRSYLEANKISHTYAGWRSLNVNPMFDQLVMKWDIGDTIIMLARKR
ncbi:MAG: methyltransferase domain-containing protein [bacterium]|jgi:2-polyprenyl-3-methyl-5-hydroxy-6-metoxy-1,4-benzoquinol methylase/tetratricopeptide (TPR) repeat protein